MKKYILGILLIATVAVVGGLKFFGNENVAHATLVCGGSTPSGSGCNCGGIYYSVGEFTSYTSDGHKNCCGSSGYEVACGAITAGGNGGSVSGDILSSNTTYYWRVLAGNAYGKSAYSQTFTFKTAAATAVVGNKPSIITDGKVAEDVYSLIATLGSWINKSGNKVNPKSATKAWVDENGQVIYPVIASDNAFKIVDALIGSRSDSGGSSGEKYLRPCGTSVGTFPGGPPGNTFPSGSYTCTCNNGTVTCAAAAVTASSTQNQ